MDYKSVQSSSIAEVAYDSTTCTMGIRFHTGREYLYSPVPEEDYLRFINATSLGRYFAQQIRTGKYPCRRIR